MCRSNFALRAPYISYIILRKFFFKIWFKNLIRFLKNSCKNLAFFLNNILLDLTRFLDYFLTTSYHVHTFKNECKNLIRSYAISWIFLRSIFDLRHNIRFLQEYIFKNYYFHEIRQLDLIRSYKILQRFYKKSLDLRSYKNLI